MKILSPAQEHRPAGGLHCIAGLICDRCGQRSAEPDGHSTRARISAFTTIDVRTDGFLRRADLCPTCASTSLAQLEAWPGAFRVLGACASPNELPRKYCFTVVDAVTEQPTLFESLLDEGRT